MPNISKDLALWYGGDTHACVGYGSIDKPACGEIIPWVGPGSSPALGNTLYACVRTEQLQIKCAAVESLYTPNFFADNWGWFALALFVGWMLYDDHKKGHGFWK